MGRRAKITSDQGEDFSTLAEENPNPVIRVDDKARVLFANPAAKRSLFGNGKSLSSLPAELASAVRRAVRKRGPLIAWLTAGTRIYEFSVVPVRNKKYVNLYGRDATEEAATQLRMVDLARFPEENPNPVLRVRFDGKLLFANKGAKTIKGLLIQQGKRVTSALSQAIDLTIETDKYRVVDIDLHGRRFAFSMTPIKSAGYVNTYGRDITQKWHAQKRADDLAKFPDENPNPVLRVSFDGKLLFANRGAKEIKGLLKNRGQRIIGDLRMAITAAIAADKYQVAEIDLHGRRFAFSMTPIKSARYVNAYGRDITAQWRAQQRAIDLAKFPDENPNPVLRVAFDGVLLFANKGAKAVRGLVNQQDQSVAGPLAKAIESTIGANEYRVVDIDLHGRRFAFSMTPIGDACYVNAYGRDVTEQWHAQQRVNDLAKFPDENPSPVIRVAVSGKVLYANRPALELPGLLTHSGTRLGRALIEPVVCAKRHGRIETRDFVSGRCVFAMTITPVGAESYLNVYGREVTKERQAQEEILRIKNFNEDILNTLTNGIMTLDSDLRVTSTNPAMRRLIGALQEMPDGKALSTLLGKGNPWLINLARKGRQANRPEVAIDQELLSLDGERRAVNLTLAPFREGSNRRCGLILAFEDISREKRIKGTMVRFMSDKVVDRLLELEETALAGVSQEVTVLFSDIRSFASLSEQHGAQEMVRTLNAYFSDMVDVIFDSGGTLDKFIGDAIMAVFGAPFQSKDDPDSSVRAAVEMLRRLRPFNSARIAEGLQPIDIGIGIDTGSVIAGTIGSPRRMDYTVIGEHVNLASRIEAVNKIYGTHILISEHTHEKLLHEHHSREIDLVRVAGIDRPVRLYEILDYNTDRTFPNMGTVLDIFAEGLAAYRKQHWRKAASAFAEALRLNPDDRPTQIFLSRCWNYGSRPPGKSWSGVTELVK